MAQYLDLDNNQAGLMVKLLDRKDKTEPEDFISQAREIFAELADEKIKKLENIIKSKTMADLPIEIKSSSVVKEIQNLFTALERSGVNNVVFDIGLMRGFDYYTGMVFEVYDTNCENSRSLFGGGRYDGLVGLFGVEPVSAVGVAPGGTTMEDFLRTHELVPNLISTTDLYIAALGDSLKEAVVLADKLREAGLNVELDLSGRKLDKQIKNVLKKDIRYMLFIGEEEVKAEIYSIKDITEAQEYKLDISKIVELVK